VSEQQFVTFRHKDKVKYGLAMADGLVDLSARYGQRWPGLKDVIADNALLSLADDAASHSADIDTAETEFLPPIHFPEKILCVGVNYPARNEEYKDGQEAPPYPSLFPRFARSFVGHNQPIIRAQASTQFDYEGEVVLVIGKAGRQPVFGTG